MVNGIVGTALFALALSSLPAAGAGITVYPSAGGSVPVVSLSGEIATGDAQAFRRATHRLDRAMVILDSAGGEVADALGIGAVIATTGFTTLVGPDIGCSSACGLVWLAGARRYMAASSGIGFHTSVRNNGAAVTSYLADLGLDAEAVRVIATAGPQLRLTPDWARQLGIEVYLVDAGGSVVRSD